MTAEYSSFKTSASEDHGSEALSGRTVHIVSSFPPEKCGVGGYAALQRDLFTKKGASVTAVTMHPEATADIHFDFYSFQGLARWLWFCATVNLELVYVHFVDGYFFPSPPKKSPFHLFFRILQAIGLWLLGRQAGCGGHMVVHEIRTGSSVSSTWKLLRNFAFSSFRVIEFHTEVNRRSFLETYTLIKPERTFVVSGARYFIKHFDGTRKDARIRLGLSPQECLFLCLGLVAPAKGFDRAIRAFRSVDLSATASLRIVGSIDAVDTAYLQELESEAEKSPGTHFHFGYLSEEDFDCWLQAADVVILPYLSIFSSGVGARASLYAKALIISDLPSLKEDFPNAAVFQDEAHLAKLFQEFAANLS